jgi:RHS repeat-associated protein
MTNYVNEKSTVKSYNYDFAGNRNVVTVNGSQSETYSNQFNRLTSKTVGSQTSNFSYDDRGNMTLNGNNMYSWDYKDRLIGATAGSKNIVYRYRNDDLLLSKIINGKSVNFYYNGSQLLCEKTVNGKLLKIYTNDNEGVLGMIQYNYNNNNLFASNINLYFLFDNLGLITTITSDNGMPVQKYKYDVWGNIENVKNDSINGLSFVGRYGGYKDWDTNLTLFTHRWYDSSIGRWISRDPIGINGGLNLYNYVDTVGKGFDKNLYRYSFNNAPNWIDPTGLQCMNCFVDPTQYVNNYMSRFGEFCEEQYHKQCELDLTVR